MPTDGPSHHQGAEHYDGAVKFPPPRRNPPRTCRVLQAMQESNMSSYEPDHEFVSNYSEDSAMPSHEPQPQHEHGRNYYYNDPKHSEIVTEDEPTLMDLFDDDYPYYNYDSFGRFAREMAQLN
ncbi:Protein of unknown function [Pyronema omphalodes CBS 100304]|uniref:Uncharacterized protein n=1 Tax=Pyronema omphalodes (strain CBS 100304) TaxID=1076935 RepID=U4LGH8_PYROM|nr:Protein of unknown function [Pyronema omphalodes CBS 100304]